MRALASGLGVSTGTLYHYFDSKDDIFEHMLVWLSGRDVVEATSLIPDDAPRRVRLELLFGWIRANAQYLSRLLLLTLDFQRHRPDEAGRALVAASSRVYRDALIEQLGPGAGGAPWSLLQGMLVHEMLDPESVDIQQHLDALVRLVETG
jgi:AcrR family transcriptional regulator